jgi:hypothetical protein
LERLAASGGMVGMVFPFFVLRIRRHHQEFLTKQTGRELLQRPDEGVPLVERTPDHGAFSVMKQKSVG